MMVGLDQTAVVYTPAAGDGDFTVEAKTGLACRLTYITSREVDVGDEREDIGSRRRLLWDETYTMPETAQIEVDGERWNVLAGTLGTIRGPFSTAIYRRCELEAAK
ncbi:MAG: hypothetical protein GY805_04995 [Chloroflexi bacterium]|nr:hypothetical protein [Chloroflexota bacterium]